MVQLTIFSIVNRSRANAIVSSKPTSNRVYAAIKALSRIYFGSKEEVPIGTFFRWLSYVPVSNKLINLHQSLHEKPVLYYIGQALILSIPFYSFFLFL